jgi:sugar phosphate permease
MATYALMQFPSGVLADRFEHQYIITAGTIVFSLAAVLIVASSSFIVVLLAVTLVGLGTGSYKTVAIRILSDVYPTRSGQAIGFIDTVGQFAGVIAPTVIVVLLSRALDWKLAFVVTAVAGFTLVVLNNRYVGVHADTLHASSSDSPVNSEGSISSQSISYLSPFLNREFSMFVGACVLYTFSWSGLTAFLPLYLISQKAFPPNLANLVYGSLFVMTVSQLLSGYLSDRIGSLPIMTILFLVAVVAMALLLLTMTTAVIVTSVFVLGAAIHGIRPVRSSHLVSIIPETVGGGTLGFVRTLMASFGAVAPAIIGILADRRGLQSAFVTLVLAFAIAFLLILTVSASNDHAIGN